MKIFIYSLLMACSLATVSCNKCYTCKGYPTAKDTTEYCEGTPQHDVLKAKGSLTNDEGQTVSCN